MKELTKKWLDYAKADLEAAEVLAKHPKSYWSYQLAVFHCHQAIEKILKTILVAQDKEIPKIHNLLALFERTGVQITEAQKRYIEELNAHYQPVRYPDVPLRGPALRYSRAAAQRHVKSTNELFIWFAKRIEK